MTTLIEQLKHFEKHQLGEGDKYGAEVLHRANERIAELTEALIAERAYHRNNTGENARRRKEAMAALPKKWDKNE